MVAEYCRTHRANLCGRCQSSRYSDPLTGGTVNVIPVRPPVPGKVTR